MILVSNELPTLNAPILFGPITEYVLEQVARKVQKDQVSTSNSHLTAQKHMYITLLVSEAIGGCPTISLHGSPTSLTFLCPGFNGIAILTYTLDCNEAETGRAESMEVHRYGSTPYTVGHSTA